MQGSLQETAQPLGGDGEPRSPRHHQVLNDLGEPEHADIPQCAGGALFRSTAIRPRGLSKVYIWLGVYSMRITLSCKLE